jgi:hypothetical protein
MAGTGPASFDTLIGHVRRKCHYPIYTKLPDSTIASILLGQIDDLTTELNLTGQLWIVRQVILPVNQGDDFVPITADGFGRPITVETWDDSNPSLDTRQVEMVNEPELVRYFGGGDAGPPGVMHSAEACAFMDSPNQPGTRCVRFGPKPGASAQYLILYEPLTNRPQQFADKGFAPMPQFEGYLTDLAAEEALPYCDWSDAKFAQIGTTLGKKIARGDSRFNRNRRAPKQTNNFRVTAFGRDRWSGMRGQPGGSFK